ncbi:hypothetical protein TRFO_36184 [Tritrichomonas foetus]|uniref:Uncharacterized protein n=1 Tax=Tritrichomonas foetus TaxID=1144522 RepID=A0A1J4JEF0_9EUKA|nr:hypothetical protein TRFO_36184 [Tritrichomonas foetus]|eukprot:OHS97574.1 hypothetical protein TRFO_36184 [Tritrichomonas foetus]
MTIVKKIYTLKFQRLTFDIKFILIKKTQNCANFSPHAIHMDDFTDSYDAICTNVRKTLSHYDDFCASLNYDEINNSTFRLKSQQSRVLDKLSASESHISEGLSDWEGLHQWIDEIKNSNLEMEKFVNQEDDFVVKLRLAFSNNASQMKSLRDDVIHCLRALPDARESPQLVRLKLLRDKLLQHHAEREEVLSNAKSGAQAAKEKVQSSQFENDRLTKEDETLVSQLDTLKGPQAHRLVQDARKHRLLLEEWPEKKKKMEDSISSLLGELHAFSGRDAALRRLAIELARCENDENRLKEKYSEACRETVADAASAEADSNAAMKQLRVEMESLRAQLIAKESGESRKLARLAHNRGERLLARAKTEASAKARTLAQVLAKLAEPKKKSGMAGNQTSNLKSIHASKKSFRHKKTTKKQSKLKNQSEEECSKHKTLFEMASDVLQKDHEKSIDDLKKRFDSEIEELGSILSRKNGITGELMEHELTEISEEGARKTAFLEAARARAIQRIGERDLELISVNSRVVTCEGVVADTAAHFAELRSKNEELRRIQLCVADEAKFASVRKEIEETEKFVHAANELAEALSRISVEKIEKARVKDAEAALSDFEEKENDENKYVENKNDEDKNNERQSKIAEGFDTMKSENVHQNILHNIKNFEKEAEETHHDEQASYSNFESEGSENFEISVQESIEANKEKPSENNIEEPKDEEDSRQIRGLEIFFVPQNTTSKKETSKNPIFSSGRQKDGKWATPPIPKGKYEAQSQENRDVWHAPRTYMSNTQSEYQNEDSSFKNNKGIIHHVHEQERDEIVEDKIENQILPLQHSEDQNNENDSMNHIILVGDAPLHITQPPDSLVESPGPKAPRVRKVHIISSSNSQENSLAEISPQFTVTVHARAQIKNASPIARTSIHDRSQTQHPRSPPPQQQQQTIEDMARSVGHHRYIPPPGTRQYVKQKAQKNIVKDEPKETLLFSVTPLAANSPQTSAQTRILNEGHSCSLNLRVGQTDCGGFALFSGGTRARILGRRQKFNNKFEVDSAIVRRGGPERKKTKKRKIDQSQRQKRSASIDPIRVTKMKQ